MINRLYFLIVFFIVADKAASFEQLECELLEDSLYFLYQSSSSKSGINIPIKKDNSTGLDKFQLIVQEYLSEMSNGNYKSAAKLISNEDSSRKTFVDRVEKYPDFAQEYRSIESVNYSTTYKLVQCIKQT